MIRRLLYVIRLAWAEYWIKWEEDCRLKCKNESGGFDFSAQTYDVRPAPREHVVAKVKVERPIDPLEEMTREEPPRDFYTKQEVDERLEAMLNCFAEVGMEINEVANAFRSRFGL